MPPLAASFSDDVDRWIDLARSGEVIRLAAPSNSAVLAELRPPRLEALYELAFLRIILSWEVYLEESFTRLVCGYSLGTPGMTLAGDPYALKSKPYSSMSAASQAILGGQRYVSWAAPEPVIDRSRQFVKGGPHETVCRSALARLRPFTDVRNRIAHSSASARQAFDSATMALIGRRYPGSSPGRFLRDWDTTLTPPQRMLTVVGQELVTLARQISR